MNILVPMDGTAHSEKTLNKACELAQKQDAKLTILQVIEATYYAGLDHDYSRAITDMRVAKDEHFMSIKPILEIAGVDWDRRLESGDAAECIVNTVEEDDFDLIVMGRHGQSFIDRLFNTATSESVLRKADCDILVVK